MLLSVGMIFSQLGVSPFKQGEEESEGHFCAQFKLHVSLIQ